MTGDIVLKTYEKDEVNKRVVYDFVRAGFNARMEDEERKYLLLINELDELNPRKNAYFKVAEDAKFVIAYKNGVPVGRVVVTLDEEYNKHHKKYDRDPVAWFGWIEFDDEKTGKKLMEAALDIAEKYKKEKNSDIKAIIGPGRPNENGIVGLRVKGDFIFFMEPDNPLRYQEIFKDWEIDENGNGYWYAHMLKEEDLERWWEKIEKYSNPAPWIKTYNKLNVGKARKPIYKIYTEAWDTADHPHGRNLEKREFNHLFNGLRLLLPFTWNEVKVAYRDKKPVAVTVFIPNFNEVIEKTDSENFEEKKRKELLCLLSAQFKNRWNTARSFIGGRVDGSRPSDVIKMSAQSLKSMRRRGIKEISFSQHALLNRDIISTSLRFLGINLPETDPDYFSKAKKIMEDLADEGKASIAVVYRKEL